MDPIVLIVVAVAALLVGAGIAWGVARSRRTAELKGRYGPEYDHAVTSAGSRSAAEVELARREQRLSQFNIRPLSPEDRDRFAERWTATQARFVDHPTMAVAEADELLQEVMHLRGYPAATDFEQRAADLSVEHPQFVTNYRAAHGIALRREQGQATTEDLRQAMVHYRALFEHLIEPGSAVPGPAAPIR